MRGARVEEALYYIFFQPDRLLPTIWSFSCCLPVDHLPGQAERREGAIMLDLYHDHFVSTIFFFNHTVLTSLSMCIDRFTSSLSAACSAGHSCNAIVLYFTRSLQISAVVITIVFAIGV